TVCKIAYATGTKEPKTEPLGAKATTQIEFKKEIKVKVITREQLQSIIKIKDIRIPADEEGNKDPKAESNTILLKDSNKWKYINKILLKSREDKLSSPASYVGIELENTGKENLIILATLNILDLKTKEPVAGFRPPAHGGQSGGGVIYSNVLIPPEESIVIALPIYAEEGEVLSGKYIARIEAKIFGSNQDIYRKDIIIKVVARNYFSFIITLIAIATALFLLLFLFFSFNLVLESFKTSQLILIALFGTATFVSVNIPGTILFDLVPVLLGPFSPFSFIITGIFYEIILYMLIMALVMLVPRVGVVTLANVVRFLMNGFILGHFNPVFLLSYASLSVALEFALYITGFTFFKKRDEKRYKSYAKSLDLQKRQVYPFLVHPKYSPRALILAAIACGIADAYNTIVFFNVYMFLYRLYYATWYIILYVVIDGFLYTAIGAPLGVILGNKLKKIEY
ncbi:MAG: hypothetical protein ACE5J9_07335, partial [Methanosarcinales archaeon]